MTSRPKLIRAIHSGHAGGNSRHECTCAAATRRASPRSSATPGPRSPPQPNQPLIGVVTTTCLAAPRTAVSQQQVRAQPRRIAQDQLSVLTGRSVLRRREGRTLVGRTLVGMTLVGRAQGAGQRRTGWPGPPAGSFPAVGRPEGRKAKAVP